MPWSSKAPAINALADKSGTSLRGVEANVNAPDYAKCVKVSKIYAMGIAVGIKS
jgi:hypothetical protein